LDLVFSRLRCKFAILAPPGGRIYHAIWVKVLIMLEWTTLNIFGQISAS